MRPQRSQTKPGEARPINTLSGNYPNPSVANGAITDAKVAAANKDGTAATPSLRTLGTGAQQAMAGNATPGGPPSGSAGGALAGTYPNQSLNVSGGDNGATACKNGEALSALSSLSALSCSPGVYSDTFNTNVAAGPSSFGNASFAGYNDSAVGVYALQSNTTGNANTALGANALQSTKTGSSNSALGVNALYANTGSGNAALGVGAGQSLTTGSNNVDIANSGVAGESSTTRIGNVQTQAFMAGVSGVNVGASPAVLVNGSGQLGGQHLL
jgi:hypothetical protein